MLTLYLMASRNAPAFVRFAGFRNGGDAINAASPTGEHAHTMKNKTYPTTRVDNGAYHILHFLEKDDHRRGPKKFLHMWQSTG